MRKYYPITQDNGDGCATCGSIDPYREPCGCDSYSGGLSNTTASTDECKEIVGELCDNVSDAIAYSECLCEDYGTEIPFSLQEKYKHQLLKNMVDRAKCDSNARVFYYSSCNELAKAGRSYMCCPKEGDIAFVHNPKTHDGKKTHGFDIYMLHEVPNNNYGKECGVSVPYPDDCTDLVWLTDCCAEPEEDIRISNFKITGDTVTITETDGHVWTQDITHPDIPEPTVYSWVAHKSIPVNMVGLAGEHNRNLGTFFTIPKTGKYHITGRILLGLDCPSGSANGFYSVGHLLKKNGTQFHDQRNILFAGNYKMLGQQFKGTIPVSWAGTLTAGDKIQVYSTENTPPGFKHPDRVQFDTTLSISWSGV